VAVAIFVLVAVQAASAIEPRQRDSFDDEGTLGWKSGGSNPNPPVQVPDAGPDGVGDGILLVSANGSEGAGGNLVAFNTEQWSGDYAAAGVIGIRAALRNLGESDLAIRLLVEGAGGAFHTQAVARLPAGGDWQHFVWPLESAEPGVDAPRTLAAVSKLRILHAPTASGAEAVAGALGVDELTALSGDACLDAGLERGDLALCRVYCDQLDCLRTGPQRACARLAARLERRTGAAPACEFDRDRDGIPDAVDNCPEAANGDQADLDEDGVGDACDNCVAQPNPAQEDTFGATGIGDACDCPCFAPDDASALAEDPLCEPICVESRPTSLNLTALQCAVDQPDYSLVVESFTDFGGEALCQNNEPAPGDSFVVVGLEEAQVAACRAYIRGAAADAGIDCR